MLPIAASERRVGEVSVVNKAFDRFGVYWSLDPSLRAAPSGAAQRARGIAQAVTEPARWCGPLGQAVAPAPAKSEAEQGGRRASESRVNKRRSALDWCIERRRHCTSERRTRNPCKCARIPVGVREALGPDLPRQKGESYAHGTGQHGDG